MIGVVGVVANSRNVADCRAGIQRALKAGSRILSKGGAAIAAIYAAITILEDDDIFDAGIGAHLSPLGRVQQERS